jgi:hypothetical protein
MAGHLICRGNESTAFVRAKIPIKMAERAISVVDSTQINAKGSAELTR